ncbi:MULTISPECIES: formylglycine-generating enzyme family protein [unclassified Vibrio]|uniref:formylglycine-generating enzyme family protein n=1 Tax=unclassified Vibrio TaxID=2614977 RepID=UPI001361C79F|nr:MULTISPECIES: SUMF1/EgtB/PvdO family nonheme iron enzyme [unclassified Vibrio]NAW56574.1 SUMF1/EgtB/PvdO family nonheme iron enzyme [Vibrio sp. V36_P2S2PM302]NAX27673.1 SUMF1/EgtB/PvdO family nonheme iron enzyme [Vibrio sp. V38_P2S17PM301]NAX29337.1 SUMF1/EgtB/PvdO family nonheme iron enzyme [Vibrio sp. V37_P2S8PM304]
MKNRWLGVACTLPLLSACSDANSTVQVTSETVSSEQIDTIVNNINTRYPEATQEQKQNAAEVVVRAIENLVFVEGGRFEMGDFGAPCEIPSRTVGRMDWSPDVQCLSDPFSEETGAADLHTVTLSDYSISKYETRFIEMEAMRWISDLPVADNKYEGFKLIKNQTIDRDSDEYSRLLSNRPKQAAKAKSWQEAKDYCQWLGEVSLLPFDLPTEAQWEYAARSRGLNYYFATNNGYRQTSGDQYFDPENGIYVEYQQSDANTPGYGETYQVDAYPPNPLGVYGMTNQVSEWVNDWYSPDYYKNSPKLNPQGPSSGTEKVLRDASGTTMTFARIHSTPEKEGYSPGVSFRCALQQ